MHIRHLSWLENDGGDTSWALSYRVSTDLQADSFDRYGWRAGIRCAF